MMIEIIYLFKLSFVRSDCLNLYLHLELNHP